MYGRLPEYYIDYNDAKNLGWNPNTGNLRKISPGKMISNGIFKNKSNKLPESPNRIWYEADINYNGGFRGSDRIIYSNDGLIFVTYDHYETFAEII